MKRIFIAIKVEPGEKLLTALSSIKAGLKSSGIKWTSLENIHITLSFLGDTEECKIGLLSDMLTEKCSGFGEFVLTIKGTGVFRNYQNPRILWLGIEESERLVMLNKLIIQGLNNLNIKTENRPFSPHLTLGRIKQISDTELLKSLVGKYNNLVHQSVPVTEVILYESILQQPGPVYKSLSRYSLSSINEKKSGTA